MDDIRWTTVEEGELTLHDHEAIAALLAQAFPDWSHWYQGGRSWAGMEPERRVLARNADGVVVAHVGIRRMFVTAGGQDTLVGSTGIVAVSPRLQGEGLGRALMERAHTVLRDLDVPFGFLGAAENRVPFYARLGWQLLHDVICTYTAFAAEGAGVTITEDDGWMVYPVRAAFEDWPSGTLLLNGQQV